MIGDLTPLERISTVFNRDVPDRVPVFNVGGVSRKVIGVSLLETMLNPEFQAKAQIAAYKTIGHDSVSVGVDIGVEPEALGCKMKFSENNQPMVLEPIIKMPEDVDKMKLPDPKKDGRMPVNIKAARILLDKIGDTVDVSAWFAGPFTLAACLRGSAFYTDLKKNPDLPHKILRFTMQCQALYGKAFLDEGIKTLCIPDPSASQVSQKLYREFDLPYTRDLFRTLKKQGARIICHICGDTTHILEDIVDTEVDCISLDQPPDLAYAKKKVGKKVCLHGNVRTIQILLNGQPSDVEQEARECIQKAAEGGGYLLGSSCDIPLGTPIENIRAMVHASKKYGQYAADGSLKSF